MVYKGLNSALSIKELDGSTLQIFDNNKISSSLELFYLDLNFMRCEDNVPDAELHLICQFFKPWLRISMEGVAGLPG
jgi:hypothetical protein